MDVFIELLSNLIQIFIYTYFITSSFGFKRQEMISKIGFAFAWFLAFVELSLINHLVVYDGFLSIIVIITLIIYANCFLKGSLFHHIFAVVFAMSVIFTLASVTIFLFSYIEEIGTGFLISNFTGNRIAILCICRIFEFLIFRFVQKINSEYSLTLKEWALFTAMPFLTWIAVTLMTDSTLVMKHIDTQIFYVALIMVVINLITFFFMYKIKQDSETKLEYELLKMHHNNVEQMEINMKALYDNTYSVKHELEKYFLYIKSKAESNDCQEIIKYADDVIHNKLNAVQKLVFTDSDIFNAIINIKLHLCKQKGILPAVNVSNDAVMAIDRSHIAVIFGNIFDNAIEAAEKTDPKIIILNVRLQGEYVSVCMENTFDAAYSDVNLFTTKKNPHKHGFGTKNVKKIVDENGGMMQCFQRESGMFCCDILLRKCHKLPNSTKILQNSTTK